MQKVATMVARTAARQCRLPALLPRLIASWFGGRGSYRTNQPLNASPTDCSWDDVTPKRKVQGNWVAEGRLGRGADTRVGRFTDHDDGDSDMGGFGALT